MPSLGKKDGDQLSTIIQFIRTRPSDHEKGNEAGAVRADREDVQPVSVGVPRLGETAARWRQSEHRLGPETFGDRVQRLEESVGVYGFCVLSLRRTTSCVKLGTHHRERAFGPEHLFWQNFTKSNCLVCE